jgi:molybdate transport system ATP-binding protein
MGGMADELTLDIEKRFPSGAVVSASFRVALDAGSILILFGPSWSGKTTVIRAVAGLERPERGSISFGRERWLDVASKVFVAPQQRRLGHVFQQSALFPHLTARANVEYGVRTRSPAADRAAWTAELLDLVGAADLADRYPRELSGGQAQRIALARALAPGPRLLLLDEPFASLDGPARASLRRLVRSSIRRLGIAAVLVTHDRHEAIGVGDCMAVLAGGRVRQVGPVADVFRRPADVVVAESVGVESVLPATVEAASGGLLDLRVGATIVRAVDAGLDGCREVFACIRSEDVVLERVPALGASARNHLPGRVTGVESEGPLERIALDCGFPLVALITRAAREELGLEVDSPVTAAVKATAIHVVPRE